MFNLKTMITAGVTAIVVALVVVTLVGSNQPSVGGTGTRFPSGLSADGTSPLAGEVRGATFTSTGAATLASLNVTGATALTGELIAKEGASTITSSTTLTSADSGTTYYAGTANLQITLPTPAEGVWYRVVVNGNFATTNMLVQGPAADATDDVIYGALEVAGAVVACSAEDTISFVNTAELPGDFISIRSDGTKWYVTGQGTTAGSITCTDAD